MRYITSLATTRSLLLLLVAVPLFQARTRGDCNGNGSSDYCSLRLNEFTFPATHNSQAYDLKFECQVKGTNWLTKLLPALNKKDLCSLIPTDNINDCVFNNQARHNFRQQLDDGIRGLDIDTCYQNNKAVLCHGQDEFVAYGSSVQDTLTDINSWMEQNPGQIITIEFGDINGSDKKKLLDDIGTQVGASGLLGKTFKQAALTDNTWPTLREMVDGNTRVVFFVNLDGGLALPDWAFDRAKFYTSAWGITHSKPQDQLEKTIVDFCSSVGADNKLWFGVDFEYAVNVKDGAKVCIKGVADAIKPVIQGVIDACDGKLPLHRVRVDRYWEVENLLSMVDGINNKKVS